MNGSVDKMTRDLGGRDFAVFAGAGISAVTGINKWKELLEALNTRACVRGIKIGDIDALHFPEIAQMLYDSLKREGRVNEYREVIRECMQPSNCSWHSIHKKIIRACSSIVTTNLDGVFEKALMDELEHPPRGVAKDQEVTYQTLGMLDADRIMNEYHITYLHGRCDKREMILKTSDYLKYYRGSDGEQETYLERVLKEIFCRREGIVFVGFSFGDRFVLETFERGFRAEQRKAGDLREATMVLPEDVKHYALMEDPVLGGEEHEKWLWENRGDLKEETGDWKDWLALDKQARLEKRLKEIHVEVIRYGHDKHVEIEPYFEGIYNKRRNVQDFV